MTFPPSSTGGGGSHVYTIKLVKGWKAGTKITFPPSAKFPNVRITFVITEANNNETDKKLSSSLQRSGNDLIFRHQLDPEHVLKKQKFVDISVVLPDGSQWKRSIPSASSSRSLLRPGQKLTVPDLGMPIKGGPERGNLIIEFY